MILKVKLCKDCTHFTLQSTIFSPNLQSWCQLFNLLCVDSRIDKELCGLEGTQYKESNTRMSCVDD